MIERVIASLAETLLHGSVNRVFAADTLGMVGHLYVEKSLPPLISLCNAASPWEVQRAAANAIGVIGRMTTEHVVPLISLQLSDHSEQVRTLALIACHAMGTHTPVALVTQVIDSVLDKSPTVQLAAVEALGAVGACRAEQARLALMDALNVESKDVHDSVGRALGELCMVASDTTLAVLFDALRGESFRLRNAASMALLIVGQRAPGRVSSKLTQMIVTGPNEIRSEAAYLLSSISSFGPDKVLPQLIRRLDADSAEALNAIDDILKSNVESDWRFIPHLIAGIGQPNESVKEHCLKILECALEHTFCVLVAYLFLGFRDESPEIRANSEAAARLLALQEPSITEEIELLNERFVEHDATSVTVDAIVAPGVIPLEAMCHENEDVRHAAAKEVATLAAQAPERYCRISFPICKMYLKRMPTRFFFN